MGSGSAEGKHRQGCRALRREFGASAQDRHQTSLQSLGKKPGGSGCLAGHPRRPAVWRQFLRSAAFTSSRSGWGAAARCGPGRL